MSKSLKSIVLISTLAYSATTMADEIVKAEQNEISTIGQIFEEGKVSGNIRSMYAGYNIKKENENNIYATALGGYLKYETAELNGFSAAAAFATSHDIGFVTGDKGVKQNDELSSSEGKYTVLSEAYLNYKYDDFNFRAGRQVIDTPLANSDDIRMIQNTFEAYIATYEIYNFNFMVGKLQKWQGYDAGLNDGWIKTGEDATYFGGAVYADDMMKVNGWYYNITKLTNAAYFDATLMCEISSDLSATGAVQYLNESEISLSGTKADIYGVKAELSAYGFTLSAAYNKSQKKAGKSSFSGFGGGALFTSMDTMILDEIANDRNAKAMVGGISYEIDDLTLSYALGDFKGEADSFGEKAHIVEQDIGMAYNIIEDKFSVSAVYAVQADRENSAKTDNDWSRLQIKASYNF